MPMVVQRDVGGSGAGVVTAVRLTKALTMGWLRSGGDSSQTSNKLWLGKPPALVELSNAMTVP